MNAGYPSRSPAATKNHEKIKWLLSTASATAASFLVLYLETQN